MGRFSKLIGQTPEPVSVPEPKVVQTQVTPSKVVSLSSKLKKKQFDK